MYLSSNALKSKIFFLFTEKNRKKKLSAPHKFSRIKLFHLTDLSTVIGNQSSDRSSV